MYRYHRTVITITILLIAIPSFAQQPLRSDQPSVMAKISYDSGIASQQNVRQICMAVAKDGEYRMVRLLKDGNTEQMQGMIPKEEFRRLAKLLSAPDFRNRPNDHAGLIGEEAQSFAVEIPLGDRWHKDGALEPEAWRSQWLNANGEQPFPASVSKVVDWLQDFQPKDGKTFEYTEFSDVCPAQGFRLLKPSVARNQRP
ncbi:MAG: hypothetical protein ABSH09_34460 [Bryobacteraceae bacterium]|jgi:hypothetical protein